MPNPYFRFKEFIIYQDQCAMKVSTDACIFGAWLAEKIPSPASVLDIGSGTGLLMLMLAQKNKVSIDGIEIDLPSFKQLKSNIGSSKWKNHLQVFPGDVRTFSFPRKYDYILSNPPFFEGDLLSGMDTRNVARHSKALSLKELLEVIDRNLEPEGHFGIILPIHRREELIEIAEARGFHLEEELSIRQTSDHSFYRVIFQWGRAASSFISRSDLTIQSDKGNYSDEFIELLKDYYLNL